MSFLFIGGCAHSGTTLLLKLLSNHSSIKSPLGILENTLDIFQKNSLACKKTLDLKHNKKTILLKNPSNILHINDIKNIYPKSKIILMYRDGRDVALSMHRRGKKKSFKGCCQYWVDRTQKILKLTNHDTDTIYILKYEDLISNPINILKELVNWIGLDADEDLLKKYETSLNTSVKKPVNEKNGKNHNQLRKWQVNQPLYNSSCWKEEMTPKQLQIFIQIAGKLLTQLNYSV